MFLKEIKNQIIANHTIIRGFPDEKFHNYLQKTDNIDSLNKINNELNTAIIKKTDDDRTKINTIKNKIFEQNNLVSDLYLIAIILTLVAYLTDLVKSSKSNSFTGNILIRVAAIGFLIYAFTSTSYKNEELELNMLKANFKNKINTLQKMNMDNIKLESFLRFTDILISINPDSNLIKKFYSEVLSMQKHLIQNLLGEIEKLNYNERNLTADSVSFKSLQHQYQRSFRSFLDLLRMFQDGIHLKEIDYEKTKKTNNNNYLVFLIVNSVGIILSIKHKK